MVAVPIAANAQSASPPVLRAPNPTEGHPSQADASAESTRFQSLVTTGLSFESGARNLHSFHVEFDGNDPHPNGALVVSLEYSHVSTRLAHADERTTIGNELEISGGIEHRFGRFALLQIETAFDIDTPRGIDQRFQQRVGVGLQFGGTGARVRIVPSVTLLHQRKNVDTESGQDTHAGVVQDLRIRINPSWSVAQAFSYRRDFTDESDFVVEGSVALTGMVTRVIGMQVSYGYSHENLLAEDLISHLQRIQAGLHLRF